MVTWYYYYARAFPLCIVNFSFVISDQMEIFSSLPEGRTDHHLQRDIADQLSSEKEPLNGKQLQVRTNFN